MIETEIDWNKRTNSSSFSSQIKENILRLEKLKQDLDRCLKNGEIGRTFEEFAGHLDTEGKAEAQDSGQLAQMMLNLHQLDDSGCGAKKANMCSNRIENRFGPKRR